MQETISRRGFGKRVIAGAATGVAARDSAALTVNQPLPQESQPVEPDLTPAQLQEIESQFNQAIALYGERLSDRQRQRLRHILTQNERMLAPIRGFAVQNADTPATVLKLHAE